jgi:histidine ammonia-lyase
LPYPGEDGAVVTVVVSTRDDFTLANFGRVCYGGETVRLGIEARRAMTAGARRRAAVRAAHPAPAGQPAIGQGRQAVSGAWFGTDFLDPAVVRGILFARLAGLVSGHAGVRPAVADRLAALLEGPMPEVPLDSQSGPGEVAPLEHVLAGLRRDDLEAGEEDALLDGAPCSAALAADTAIRARHRIEHAESICALSIEGFGAPLSAYDEALDDLWGDAYETAALRALRRHLAGAYTAERRFHQAPVSYRIIPRVLGQARRAVAGVEKAATVSLRSVSSGTVYVAGAGGPGARAVRSGGYLCGMAYPALNGLSAAWADLALVAERQVSALNTAETSGLPVNLAAPRAPGLGTYGYGWAASGYVEEARAAAGPALLPAFVDDPFADVLSPTFSAYRRERRASECLDGALAILAIVSSQALFVTGRNPAQPLRSLISFVRSVFPPIDGTGERDFSAEGGRLQEALRVAAVTNVLAPLSG